MIVKTIDINTKEWFDKINGNSYFSANVTLNYGLNDSVNIKIPFQYGYGDHSKYVCIKKLNELGYINTNKFYELDKYNIILRYNKQENCKKRELINN
jgi:uncharacterized protein YdgA (DUF945 family)